MPRFSSCQRALLRGCLAVLIAVGFALARAHGAIDAGSRMDELKLQDGRVLKNVTLVSFGTATVMAKWDGGRGTIAYALLPSDVQSELKSKVPPPAPADGVAEK